ncbi:MAG: hypothetical protein NTZ55_01625 [Candidatus Roizmanbacteria bacterium]|nr:hypothetical protein [Candidatus Roizmanbacteria bacterium]
MKTQFFNGLKIISILMLSLGIATLCNAIFFINDSATLRSHPEQYIASNANKYLGGIFDKSDGSLNKIKTQKAIIANMDEFKTLLDKVKTEPMKQISKGTYAQTYSGKTITTVNLDEIPYKIYTYTITIKGEKKTITIRVPETDTPPSQSDLEAITK